MDHYNIQKYGIHTTGSVYRNIPAGSLIEKALIKKDESTHPFHLFLNIRYRI